MSSSIDIVDNQSNLLGYLPTYLGVYWHKLQRQKIEHIGFVSLEKVSTTKRPVLNHLLHFHYPTHDYQRCHFPSRIESPFNGSGLTSSSDYAHPTAPHEIGCQALAPSSAFALFFLSPPKTSMIPDPTTAVNLAGSMQKFPRLGFHSSHQPY